MRNNPKKVLQSILNTLDLLTDNELTIYHNRPVFYKTGQEAYITWPNHKPGRFNCEPNFGKIHQYHSIIERGAYTCLLCDGAMIRVSYIFIDDYLTNHSLLWWPSPFPIDKKDYELGAVLDIFDLYADSQDWHKQIQMRTPIRFDFDAENVAVDHPASHLHLQSSKCRLFIDTPICFNRFVKFIFRHFYPEIYSHHSFWKDLEIMYLSSSLEAEWFRPNEEHISWADRLSRQ